MGMSSDHLVVDVGDVDISVGDEISMGVRYGALLRAMTSPFVTKLERTGRTQPVLTVGPRRQWGSPRPVNRSSAALTAGTQTQPRIS
jgi:hypothetical protein